MSAVQWVSAAIVAQNRVVRGRRTGFAETEHLVQLGWVLEGIRAGRVVFGTAPVGWTARHRLSKVTMCHFWCPLR
jgi:hypothetical protein